MEIHFHLLSLCIKLYSEWKCKVRYCAKIMVFFLKIFIILLFQLLLFDYDKVELANMNR